MLKVKDLNQVKVKTLRFEEEAWDGIEVELEGDRFIFEMHFAGGGQSYSVTCLDNYDTELYYFESNKLIDVKRKVYYGKE